MVRDVAVFQDEVNLEDRTLPTWHLTFSARLVQPERGEFQILREVIDAHHRVVQAQALSGGCGSEPAVVVATSRIPAEIRG